MKKRYLLRVMRLLIIFMLAGLMHVTAATYSQTVTIKGRNLTLAEVFKEITEQTGYEIGGYGNVLQSAKAVTVDFEDVALPEAMRRILAGQQIDFTITDKTIIIKEAPRTVADAVEAGTRVSRVPNERLILAIPTVTGRITDTLGQPLSGASVVVLSPEGKRTSLQTTTKANGIFVLENVPEGAMLRISFMGYVEQELPAKAQLGTVQLKPSESPLDEVQVMAYGTTSRRLSTGNIGTVRAKDIENQPVTNPLLALQGRVPGLVVTQTSGVPGAGVQVRIQGQNSLSAGGSPLYVVDGVMIESFLLSMNGDMLGNSGVQYVNTVANEGNVLSYLNPADIESIDVLKDADATAIYGSRAANGAILITTKKGQAGKMQLDIGVNTGFSQVPFNDFKMMNTRQYLDMRYEAFRNDGIDWRSPSVNAPDLTLWDTTRYTDWRKELLGGTGIAQQVTAGLSGGNTAMQYRLAGTYNKTGSVFPDNGNGNPIGSVSASINSTSANQRLRMGWTANYQYNHNEMPTYNFLSAAWLLPPHAPAMLNPDGTINWAPDANGNTTYNLNPYRNMEQLYTNTQTNLISSLVLGYKIWRELEISTSLGYNSMQGNDFRSIPAAVMPPEYRSVTQSQAFYGSRTTRSWMVEPQINYKTDTYYGKIDLLLGATLRESLNGRNNIMGTNHISDALLKSMAAAATLAPAGVEEIQYKYLAYFGRLAYNLSDQLLLNVNIRRDGSSRFGDNKRFSNFWSVGGGWIFTRQQFLEQHTPWLSFGKLTASYGITGNDQVGDFQYIRTYRSYPLEVSYQGIAALQTSGVPNPELVWERVKKFSSGLDLGFLRDRLLLNVTYARNHSDNQLQGYQLSSVTGASSQIRNWNDVVVRNTTWEFSLSTANIKKVDFVWSSNFNLSIARNKLTSYPDLERSPYRNQMVLGQSIDNMRVYRYGGVNAATGEYQFLDKNGNPTAMPGADDMVFRSFFPTFYGGFQNTVRYKRISLDFFIQFTKKWGTSLEYYNGEPFLPGEFYLNQGAGGNQPVSVLDRWQQPGDNAKYAKYSTVRNNAVGYLGWTDAYYMDASFARLKNLSLSWQLPMRWVQKFGLQSAGLTASGQNLFTLTPYYGPDPETTSLRALPPLRVYTFGVRAAL